MCEPLATSPGLRPSSPRQWRRDPNASQFCRTPPVCYNVHMSPYQVQLKLPVQITKQGKRFVAWTPVLDLSTSGRTVIEAKKRFAEAVRLFIEELIEAGTVDEVLLSLGWTRSQQSWSPPRV